MATCYGLDGNPASEYYPCNQTAILNHQHTSCCKNGENCFTNGLCRSTGEGSTTNYFWLEGCTDPTFSDPACSIREPCRDFDSLYWKCLDPKAWCCNNGGAVPHDQRSGHINTTCCSIKEFMFTALDPVVYTKAAQMKFPISTLLSSSESTSSQSSKSPSTSMQPTTSAPNTTNPTAEIPPLQTTPSKPSSPSNNISLSVGLGVGLGVGIIALSAILYILAQIKRRRRIDTNENNHAELPVVSPRFELVGNEAAAEAMTEKTVYEMRA